MAGELAKPLRETLKECQIGLVLLAILSFFINLLILTSPIYMMQVYDRVLTSGRTETLVLLTIIAGIAVLVLGLLEMVRSKVLGRIGRCWIGGCPPSSSAPACARRFMEARRMRSRSEILRKCERFSAVRAVILFSTRRGRRSFSP
jgi:ABC-type bacteriocin/lantibiotic exporter with double-glycine peptidase domain